MLRRPVMRGGTWSLAIVAGVWLAGAPAHALVFGGGGSSKTDCLLVFDAPVNDPPTKPKKVRCTDGDPACDADGLVNGVCTFGPAVVPGGGSFPVGVCANSTFDPLRCTLNGVDSITVEHALDNGDPKFDVDFQALQNRINSQIETPTTSPDRCTTPGTVRVFLQGPFPGDVCKRAKKQIKSATLSTVQDGKVIRDKDKLQLTCEAPIPCDPQVLFAGTFDRIQRQIFNQSCAVSGCHDSNTQAGNMLLESGGAYSNIVDVIPSNLAAAGLGWRRVDAANADPDTSFLYHKITGDLDDDLLGERMPFQRRKLDEFLADIVRLWIEAGAPQTGWVPGTD